MRIPVLCLTLILLLAAPLLATPYWTPADAERARAEAVERQRAESPPLFSRATPAEYLDDFEAAVWFIASMQVSDPLDPDYGGIREGEHLLDIIQTDNTSESIWMFSRYYELTGDSSILPQLDASWTYVLNHPAYDEEGGYFPQSGYYRYYNCGWAVRAGMKYEEVFSDPTYKVYVDSCANYLATYTLTREGTSTFHYLVNPPVLAWGAGNLRKYGVVYADSIWKDRGWKRGRRAKGWVEEDSLVLGNEEWAMSGGAVMWGILESYFDEYPGEEAAWVATYVAQMDTIADPGDFENAWQGWYALGEKRLQESTGDPVWGDRHRNLTDYLLAFDTDHDGGIQANPGDLDTQDQAWVTAYLGFMGLHPLIEEATSAPGVDIGASAAPLALLPNRPNPFRVLTSIPFRLSEDGQVVVEMFDVGGRRVARLADGNLSAGPHTVTWDGRDRDGREAAAGVYYCRVQAGAHSRTRSVLLIR
jgi:hypothetical protein